MYLALARTMSFAMRVTSRMLSSISALSLKLPRTLLMALSCTLAASSIAWERRLIWPPSISSMRSMKRPTTASRKRICSRVATVTKFFRLWFSGSTALSTAPAMFSESLPSRSFAILRISAVCSCW